VRQHLKTTVGKMYY